MPNVGSRTVQAKETVGGTTFKNFVNVQANLNGWKNVKKMFVYNGSGWVEVWNNRPEVSSTSMTTTSSSALSFTGSADPNWFETTAKFQFREVGTSTYTDSSTTTSGMEDGVNGAVSFTVTATVSDAFKNWEAYAVGTNAGGTSTGGMVYKDCRKHFDGGSGWESSSTTQTVTCAFCTCGSNSTRTDTIYTYTKDGCPTYNTVSTGFCPACGYWYLLDYYNGGPSSVVIDGVTYTADIEPGYYYQSNPFGTSCGGGCLIDLFRIEECTSTGVRRATFAKCAYVDFC